MTGDTLTAMTHDVDDTPPSRSARKREAEALQALGLRLAQLSERERRRLPLEPGAELHCAADRLSVAYRRYLRKRGITFGVC